MSSTLEEVQKFLKDPPLSLPFVKRGSLPASGAPYAAVAVQEYPGEAPAFVFGQAPIAAEYPRVQIVFRGEPDELDAPMAQAQAAYRALAAQGHGLINGTRYLQLLPLGPPFQLKQDHNGCWVWAMNVRIEKELSV